MLNETVLLAQNKRLREENDELRETVRQYQEKAVEPLPAGVPYLSVREEAVFRALLRGGSAAVTRETIYANIYGHDSEVLPHIIDVFISHLRVKFAGSRYNIQTVRARGWKMLVTTVEEAREAA
jgi:DNA-binding response OmpR family regulator